MHRIALIGAVSAAALSTTALGVTINEIRIDQPSTDVSEYFELFGLGGESLDGLTYIVIGDGAGGSGVVESITDLTGFSTNANGFFLAAEDTFDLGGTPDLVTTLGFENSDNVTHLLVSGFSGMLQDDVDTDDDGVIDNLLWGSVVDSVALVETPGSGDLIYSDVTVGPDGDFVPGHVFRFGDGTGDWTIGGFAAGTDDTAGFANIPAPGAIALLGLAGLCGRRRRA